MSSALVLGLAVPEQVVLDRERDAQVTAQLDAALEFTHQLRAIDPHLELVLASENADSPDLMPGCWHIRRANPDTVDTYIPLCTPEGRYTAPHSGHLEMLRRGDLQRIDVQQMLRRRREAEARAREQAREEAAREARETFLAHAKARLSPGVSMSGQWRHRLQPLGDW